MSHELHNLVTKIENACDSESYEVADTEHLVRLAVAEYVVAQNGLVASARVVDPNALQKVIDRHIRENISAADPQTWFANVATKVADFLELAYEDRTNNEAAEHVDLLPMGHPRNIKNLGLTASARMQAVAEWAAADPRITSDLGRQAVYNAYRAKPESLEATYANAKVEALAASGVLPADFAYEAIVASFKNMSFAERSARSKALAAVRRRDRRKRFANEFGRLRGFFSKGDGTMFSATGKIAGAVPGENKYYVEYDGSDPEIPKGLYVQDASKSENVKALLSTRALKNAPNLRKPAGEFDKFDQDSAVSLEEFLATKVDAPNGWTKNKDGSFTSETGNTIKEVTSLPDGDYYFEGAGENNEQDLGETLFEIRDSSGELVGVAQDWNGIQKIALTHDKMKETEAKKAPEVNDATVAEALDGLENEANWDDPDGVPSYDSPNGILSVSFNEDGDTDGEGGMRDASFWSATLDPEGEAIDLGTWGGRPDDDFGDIAERVSKAYEEYKAKKAGEAAPAEPKTEAPAKPEVKQTEKSKPSYLDQKPKSQQSTLKKYSGGYVSDGNQDINVDITDNKDGTYTVDHGYTFLADENAEEIQFDDGAKTFESEEEALAFANEKLAYYNSRRVDEDAANDAFDRQLDSAPERGLGQDVPEEAPAKPVKPLSEKQMEPASPKQYALLKEFQEERDGIDENQNQAINDALEKQNLSKAQMASLFGDLQKKPFKPEIDPNKPTDRMIDSLRDYLTNKELTPDEINSALDELEAGLDRAGVEKLLAKLRRRPDKAKEDGLGQDIPSDLTPQDLANGYSFSKQNQRDPNNNTWVATGFPNGEETFVEVTQGSKGRWFTTEYSGGNGESGFTRESEKQHDNPQEAFEYAAEVAQRGWDQDQYEDLRSFGVAPDPTASAPDLDFIDEPDVSWTIDEWDNGDPQGGGSRINTASYVSPDGRVKAEVNYDTDGESSGLYLSLEIDGKEVDLSDQERSFSESDDVADFNEVIKAAVARQFGESEQGLGQAAPSTKMAEDATDAQYNYISSMLNGKEVPEELAAAAKQAIEDRNLSKAQVGEIIGKMRDLPNKEGFDPNAPTERMIESVKRNIVAKGLSQEDQDAILQDLPNMDKATMSELIGRLKAMDDVNAPEEGLSQQSIDDLDAEVEDLASGLDGETEPFTSGNGLRRSIEDFNDPRYRKYASIRMQSVNDIRDLAADRIVDINGMNISERLNNLADKLEAQLIGRFGFADVAKTDNENNEISLSDVVDAIQTDKGMYFETDANVLAEKLESALSYGDSKSGGAEVFVSQEEDGTWTATVDYDRDFEEFKSEDRDEVIQQAATAAADYNRDAIPSSYSEDADLDREAQDAKSEEEALAFADKLDTVANDISENRGDPQNAFDLRDYAQRIRDLVAKRKSQQPEQGLGQEAPDASAIYDRSRELAWNRAEPYSSDEDYTQESEAIRTQLEEIQEHIADRSLTDLRNMLNDPDYALVREDAQKAINKIDADLNSAVDEAIASGDINKLESLLDDPDFAEFDLVLKEKIDELKAGDEGSGQELPKA